VPFCMFTDPELARVGLNESEARQEAIPYTLAKIPMAAVLRTRTLSETRGFLKALVGAESDEILGFTAVGTEGGELMSVVQTAILAKLPYTALRDAILAHPTMAEGLTVLFACRPDPRRAPGDRSRRKKTMTPIDMIIVSGGLFESSSVHAWRDQRWDSFTLVTPNWQVRMSGAEYQGAEPDGQYIEQYVARFRLPVRYGVEVNAVGPTISGGRVFLSVDGPNCWEWPCAPWSNCSRRMKHLKSIRPFPAGLVGAHWIFISSPPMELHWWAGFPTC